MKERVYWEMNQDQKMSQTRDNYNNTRDWMEMDKDKEMHQIRDHKNNLREW